jgi:hypothetical protein
MSTTAALAIIGFVLWCLCSKPSNRAATGHMHGGRRRTRAIHEAGHYVAAKAVGGGGDGVELTRRGGQVNAHLPNAKAEIVFQLAGGMAAGTGAGCSGDNAEARRALNEYPPGQRARVWREAQAEARRIVSSRRGEIRRVAERLDRNGHV